MTIFTMTEGEHMPTRPIRPYKKKRSNCNLSASLFLTINQRLPLFSPLNNDDLQLSQVTLGPRIDFAGMPWIF